MKAYELIQSYYQSFNERDLDGFLKTLHSEVIHDTFLGETEIGIEAFRKYMEVCFDCVKETVRDSFLTAGMTVMLPQGLCVMVSISRLLRIIPKLVTKSIVCNAMLFLSLKMVLFTGSPVILMKKIGLRSLQRNKI